MVKFDNTALVQQEIQMDLAESKLRSLKIKRWLKTDEVALYLGSNVDAIKKAYQRGKLSANKFCGRLYFDRELLDQLIERSGTGAVLAYSPAISRKRIRIPAPRQR